MTSRPLLGEVREIRVDADRWRVALSADCWPFGFPTDGSVWRQDVFDVAERWRVGEISSRQLCAAVLMWGYGPIGYGRWRANQTLATDPDGSRLDGQLELLRPERISVGSLAETYRRFLIRPRLPYLGPAYFTKLIYFAGYRRSKGGIQPLILDRVVARRLPPAAGVNPKTWLWPVDQWMSYIEWATTQGTPEPDQVEMAYFNDNPLESAAPAPPGD